MGQDKIQGVDGNAYSDFNHFNRDVIRKVAAKAGVVNVSYKSKAENIAAMEALGVIGIYEGWDDKGDLVILPVWTEDRLPNTAAATEAASEVADRLAGLILDEVDVSNAEIISVSEVADEADWEAAIDAAPTVADLDGDGEEPHPADGEVDPFPLFGEPDVPTRSYNFSIHSDGRSVVTFVSNGDLVSVSDDHPGYVRVLEALLSGQDPVEPYLDEAIQVQYIVDNIPDSRLSLRFEDGTIDSKPTVLFDGEPIHGRMVDLFLRYHLEGRSADNLVRFLERCAQNPVPGASQQLFDWAGGERLTIDADGYFIGFKSLLPTEVPGVFKPGHAGPGAVNGNVPLDGVLRQKVGDIVTIDPALVLPGAECSVGLHVGSWAYASTFHGSRGVVTEVRVDPADVVNVPRSETGKLRCVQYEVTQIHERSDGNASHHEPAPQLDSIEVVLAGADVPKGFWKRLLGRRGR